MQKTSLYLIIAGIVIFLLRGPVLLPIVISVPDPKIMELIFISIDFLIFALIASGAVMRIYYNYKYRSQRVKTKGSMLARIGLLIAFGPLLIAVAAMVLGWVFGCESSGGGPGTCTIGGDAMGDVVWTGVMIHWFTLLTFLPGLMLWLSGALWHNALLKKLNANTPNNT